MRLTLAAVLMLAFWLEGGRSVAQDGLGLGGLSFTAYPGYSYYALPVANAGMGRDWVTSRSLQWQVAYNYSVVPVRIEFEHRMPNAFKGRIEIVSPDSFYAEEAMGSFPAVYSQDILVPPSVPHSYMFAPRICPQSQIMGPVEFTVRLYKSGMVKPIFTQTVSAIQLEPGYLHSLWLDGTADEQGNPGVLKNSINPGNKLGLQLPSKYSGLDDILSSLHFIISVDHRQVTGLPLAARDFAFVVADLSQVRLWPEDEQLALVSFMTGGGHLCMFNSGTGPWMGLALDQPTAVGRGFLVPVPGGITEARQAMVGWLEGELEELVLWSGGKSSGWRIKGDIEQGNFGWALDFLKALASGQPEQKVVSHRPGYLNPIWIYRETCRSGALEAWESALTLNLGQTGNGLGIANPVPGNSQRKQAVKLIHLATPLRSFPEGLQIVLFACPFFVVVFGLARRRRGFAVGLLCLAVAAGLYCAITAEANPPGRASLVLIDVDSRCEAGSIRYITATSAGSNGAISTALPTAPVVRHLSLDRHTPWRVSEGKGTSMFEATSVGSRAVLSSDGTVNLSSGLPIEISVNRDTKGNVVCTIDTSRLPPGTKCLVQLPSGWAVVHGGEKNAIVSIQIPQITVKPGKARLQAWSDYFLEIMPTTDDPTFEVIIDARISQKLITESFDPEDVQQELQRFGWDHLLRLPLGLRGAMQDHGVVYFGSPSASFSTGLDGREAVFWRITFPLVDSR